MLATREHETLYICNAFITSESHTHTHTYILHKANLGIANDAGEKIKQTARQGQVWWREAEQ